MVVHVVSCAGVGVGNESEIVEGEFLVLIESLVIGFLDKGSALCLVDFLALTL